MPPRRLYPSSRRIASSSDRPRFVSAGISIRKRRLSGAFPSALQIKKGSETDDEEAEAHASSHTDRACHLSSPHGGNPRISPRAHPGKPGSARRARPLRRPVSHCRLRRTAEGFPRNIQRTRDGRELPHVRCHLRCFRARFVPRCRTAFRRGRGSHAVLPGRRVLPVVCRRENAPLHRRYDGHRA